MEITIGNNAELDELRADEHVESGHGSNHDEQYDDHHDEHHDSGHIPELENIVDYIILGKYNKDLDPHDPAYISIYTLHGTVVAGRQTPPDNDFAPQMSITWWDIINIIYAFLAVFLLTLVAMRVSRRLSKIPKGFQAIVELFVQWMDNYTRAIIGRQKGRAFTPFIGTLFIFILTLNYLGLVPFMKSPVALNINMPIAMAICVFFLVQYHGIKENGFVGYVKHFAGQPAFLIPLNFPLHLIGELAKPITLSLRLFGNITGEDVVLAALVGLTAGLAIFLPIPLQALFYPLGMLFGFIQALVFATLSAVYILMMTAHEEHH